MFFIELMASRFDIFGSHDHKAADPAKNLLRDTEKYGDSNSTLRRCKNIPLCVGDLMVVAEYFGIHSSFQRVIIHKLTKVYSIPCKSSS